MAENEAYLRVMSAELDEDKGKHWELQREEKYRIGRSRKCAVSLEDPSVSGEHAVLECRGETWFVCDTDSTHGTRVNRQRIVADKPLFDRDVVWVGRTLLQFRQYEQLDPDDLAEMDRGVELPEEA